MPDPFRLQIDLNVFATETDLPQQAQAVFAQAQEATKLAYAPYSHFLVGAALLLADGRVHLGNNQENAAYPSGLCAERSALFGLRSQDGDTLISLIAVTARREAETRFLPVTPCGACRQVMVEYEQRQGSPIQFLMQVPDGRFLLMRSVKDLLPFQFSKDNLLIS